MVQAIMPFLRYSGIPGPGTLPATFLSLSSSIITVDHILPATFFKAPRKLAPELIMSLFPKLLCAVMYTVLQNGIHSHQHNPLPALVSSLRSCRLQDHIHIFPMMWQSGLIIVNDQVSMPSLQLVGHLPKCAFQAMTCRAVLTHVMFREQLGARRGCAMTLPPCHDQESFCLHCAVTSAARCSKACR